MLGNEVVSSTRRVRGFLNQISLVPYLTPAGVQFSWDERYRLRLRFVLLMCTAILWERAQPLRYFKHSPWSVYLLPHSPVSLLWNSKNTANAYITESAGCQFVLRVISTQARLTFWTPVVERVCRACVPPAFVGSWHHQRLCAHPPASTIQPTTLPTFVEWNQISLNEVHMKADTREPTQNCILIYRLKIFICLVTMFWRLATCHVPVIGTVTILLIFFVAPVNTNHMVPSAQKPPYVEHAHSPTIVTQQLCGAFLMCLVYTITRVFWTRQHPTIPFFRLSVLVHASNMSSVP